MKYKYESVHFLKLIRFRLCKFKNEKEILIKEMLNIVKLSIFQLLIQAQLFQQLQQALP